MLTGSKWIGQRHEWIGWGSLENWEIKEGIELKVTYTSNRDIWYGNQSRLIWTLKRSISVSYWKSEDWN